MNTYQYSAKDKNGQPVSGALGGASEKEVADLLHQKGFIVISVNQIKIKSIQAKRGKVKMDDLVIFSRQLSTLIDAGIPLVQALDILSQQIERKALQDVVIGVRQDIEGGVSFCDALAKHPEVFSEFFTNMVRAGEASGMLDEVLDRLSAYLEKTSALARKIRASLVYPAVVVSMAVLITAVLLLKVVPTFQGIFEMLGGQLPLATRILIGTSVLFRKYFLLLIAALIVLSFLLKKYMNTKGGRYFFDGQKLRIPILGALFCKVAIAKFSRTFSTLVKSGVPILNVLDIVAVTSGNKVVEETLLSCRQAVRNGEPIAGPLSRSKVFPAMVSRMVEVGEKTGQLEKMLSKIADFYDSQVDAAVAGLTSMIEPIVIAFLGVVIGGIVISLFLPIFKITELIAR